MVRTILLAGGASSRMGRPKAGLPLRHASDTFLARLVQTSLMAGLPDVVVVSGADPPAVKRAAGRVDRRVRIIENKEWRSGQLSSLQAGLALPSRVPLEAAVMMLVDVPLVSVVTVQHLVAIWRATRAPIVRPARGEQHGHPVIFDAVLFEELRHADRTVGAKGVVRAHATDIHNVPCDDEGAYVDVDTLEQYQQLRMNDYVKK